MNVKIQGKQMDVGAAFQTHITNHIEERVGKYFDRAVDATVIMSKDSYFTCAEIVVHPGQQSLSIQARPRPAPNSPTPRLTRRSTRSPSGCAVTRRG